MSLNPVKILELLPLIYGSLPTPFLALITSDPLLSPCSSRPPNWLMSNVTLILFRVIGRPTAKWSWLATASSNWNMASKGHRQYSTNDCYSKFSRMPTSVAFELCSTVPLLSASTVRECCPIDATRTRARAKTVEAVAPPKVISPEDLGPIFNDFFQQPLFSSRIVLQSVQLRGADWPYNAKARERRKP